MFGQLRFSDTDSPAPKKGSHNDDVRQDTRTTKGTWMKDEGEARRGKSSWADQSVQHADGCTDIHSLSGCTPPPLPSHSPIVRLLLRKLYEYESDEKSTITCQGRFRPRAYEPHSRRPSDDFEQCIVVKQQQQGSYTTPPSPFVLPPAVLFKWNLFCVGSQKKKELLTDVRQ